jgi:ABC-2 type transport system permease protein
MERKRDVWWLTNWRVLTLCGSCLFAGFLIGLLFFGSPIIYTATRYPKQVQDVLSLSPIAAVFTQMRHALIDPTAPTAADTVGGPVMLLIPLAIVAGTVALGLWLFSREAPRVAERL